MISECRESDRNIFSLYVCPTGCFSILGKLCENVYNHNYVVLNSEFNFCLLQTIAFFSFLSACTVFQFGYKTNRMCQTKRKHRRNMNGLLTGKSEGQENVTAVKFSLSCQLEQPPSDPSPPEYYTIIRAPSTSVLHTPATPASKLRSGGWRLY